MNRFILDGDEADALIFIPAGEPVGPGCPPPWALESAEDWRRWLALKKAWREKQRAAMWKRIADDEKGATP